MCRSIASGVSRPGSGTDSKTHPRRGLGGNQRPLTPAAPLLSNKTGASAIRQVGRSQMLTGSHGEGSQSLRKARMLVVAFCENADAEDKTVFPAKKR